MTNDELINIISHKRFFMLRYETEFTPCTGITAVSKQERRHFLDGAVIAPWCPALIRKEEKDDPVTSGKVRYVQCEPFNVYDKKCRILVTSDEYAPIIFLEIEGQFRGLETPYDVPIKNLKLDTLYFGIGVREFLTRVESSKQFVWGADWETVPALYLVRERHHVALTIHNSFDECLSDQAGHFGDIYKPFLKNGRTPTNTRLLLK